jgi:altronate dehydratase small subunit
MTAADALRLHADDTVVVALRDIAAGERLTWRGAGAEGHMAARQAVPLGHKLSLAALPAGSEVRKYGAAIGRSAQAIAAGEHVHVHNIVSMRARRAP